MLAGDPAAAKAALDDAERVAGKIGDRWFHSTILVDRAHVVLALERSADDAAAAVARIEEIAAPNDHEWRIKRHSARGKLAARTGDSERALAEARAAVALADETELFLFRADARRDLVEVAIRCDAPEEAAQARATALALYRAKGNVAAADQLSAAAPPKLVEGAREHGDDCNGRQHEQLELQPLALESRGQRRVRDPRCRARATAGRARRAATTRSPRSTPARRPGAPPGTRNGRSRSGRRMRSATKAGKTNR